jgi:hypothetical protein
MKSTARLSRLDTNSARLALTIPAPHFGRSRRGSGAPLPSSPISRIARQADPISHFGSAQVVPRRGQAKNSHSYHERHAARVIPLPAGGPAAIIACKWQFTRLLLTTDSITKTFEICHFCVSIRAHDAHARPRVYVSNPSLRVRQVAA